MINLNEMSAKELKEMAKELKVKNWWTLKKAELIEAIEAAQTETTENVQNESESAEEAVNEESIVETEETAQDEPETTDDDLVPMPGAEKLADRKSKSKDMITYNGKTQNLSQWAKELGMPGQTLFARIHLSNWTVEKAFTTPVKKRNKKEEA